MATLFRLAKGIAPAACLILLALWASWRTTQASATVIQDADWQDAAEFVRQAKGPDDLIVFAPGWLDPVGRLYAGDMLSVADASRLGAERFHTIWQFSRDGARHPDVRNAVPTLAQQFGRLHVTRFSQASQTVIAESNRLLPVMRTSGAMARGPSLELAEVGFTPRRCVQVVPMPGSAVTLTVDEFKLGRTLALGVGLADVFTRRDVRTPGELQIVINGQRQATQLVGVDDGWVRFDVATSPGLAQVQFVVRSPSPKGRDRLVCFAAEAWL